MIILKYIMIYLSIELISGTLGFQKIECANYSASVTVVPHIDGPTQLILDFRLLSEEQLCHSRRKIPKFHKLHISPASYVTTCEQCPQCYFTFPMQFELPISWSIDRLFVVTKSQPHHQSATDVPIHYVIVDKMPPIGSSLRNCRIHVPSMIPPISDNFQIKFLAGFFISAFGVMLLIRCFCIKTR
ncbi:Phosphatidylinositol-glycan biosynthesis class X protein [Caenorhabditis elegans]|uniref:Phosphatidylinositol-glycan biosynthesis class X protein n=1 Tax=Caenorhabditis elegans TaxID=6239 RepID=Q9N5L2_CAEEL|nr:Phosphatidylinositol-glycan biosynthesis class X protein [Caenorhabditis elegans]CCD68982.3 Phosphatidylinositol-glycan biosynthesis class X protein [Caenorhabditis elegans]|eukprot:NP_501498.4 Uncharacterized protein CELE_H23L24.1 [Caenorhabditis elegans]